MTHTELAPAASVEAYYGHRLRRERETAGISQDELGRRMHYTGAAVQHIETGRRRPTVEFSAAADTGLDTDDLFTGLWHLMQRCDIATWFRDFAELEAQATAISSYTAQVVTGLLQTPDYAKATMQAFLPEYTAAERDRDLKVRMGRQELLERDDPPLVWFIADEAALRRPIGGVRVMCDQLGHLLRTMGRPRVVVQVLPFSAGGHTGLTGPFTLLELPGEDDVAYVEARGHGRLITEPDEVLLQRRAFDRLRAVALSEADSFRMIASILEEYDHDGDT